MMDFTAGLPGKHEGPHKTSSSKRRAGGGMFIALIITSVVAVVSTTTAAIYFVKYNNLKKDPTISAQNNNKAIMAKVAKLYDVPKEDPSLARISDANKLKKQEFFKNAQNGDYVLVYPEAKLGILYRESSNKIVNIGPVATEDQQQGTTPQNADETQDQQ